MVAWTRAHLGTTNGLPSYLPKHNGDYRLPPIAALLLLGLHPQHLWAFTSSYKTCIRHAWLCMQSLKNKAVERKNEKEKILSVSVTPSMNAEEWGKVLKGVQRHGGSKVFLPKLTPNLLHHELGEERNTVFMISSRICRAMFSSPLVAGFCICICFLRPLATSHNYNRFTANICIILVSYISLLYLPSSCQ